MLALKITRQLAQKPPSFFRGISTVRGETVKKIATESLNPVKGNGTLDPKRVKKFKLEGVYEIDMTRQNLHGRTTGIEFYRRRK
ncbi:hypothetical protein K0U07_03440 [bacterium]|nr:hypothetical protein [bacterium]